MLLYICLFTFQIFIDKNCKYFFVEKNSGQLNNCWKNVIATELNTTDKKIEVLKLFYGRNNYYWPMHDLFSIKI